MDEFSCPKLASHVRLQKDRITGETVLLAPETALTLNEIAVDVLGLCDGARTTHQIAEALSSSYEAGVEEILPDVRELIARLAARGYVLFAEGS